MRNTFALLVLLVAGACGLSDKDRLYEKIVTDCRMFPAGPMCVMTSTEDREELSRKVFDLWVDDAVNNAVEQDCILNVECNGDADDHEQLRNCISQTKSFVIPREAACLQKCSENYINCGPENCSSFDIEACHREERLCKRFCPPG